MATTDAGRLERASNLVMLCMTIFGLTACATSLDYRMEVASYGAYGVIVKDPPFVAPAIGKRSGKLGERFRVNPGIPGVHADFFLLDHFTGYPDSLPEAVTIKWQLAELLNCEEVREVESMVEDDPDPKTYVRKEDCDWQPIEGKEYSHDIDMAAIRRSEAYRKTGKGGSIWGGHNTLIISLIFREGALEVQAANGRSAAFMQ